jgi:hypothetical protein
MHQRDANLGHLAHKNGITPRRTFMNMVKEAKKYLVCLSQILLPAFAPCMIAAGKVTNCRKI